MAKSRLAYLEGLEILCFVAGPRSRSLAYPGKLKSMPSPNWKEGQRVRVRTRQVTEDDRKTNRYFDHMAGLTGTIQNIYTNEEIAIKVDPDCMSAITRDVHKTSTERMRAKFLDNVSDEQKKQLTSEELNFEANYTMLVKGSDLELLKTK